MSKPKLQRATKERQAEAARHGRVPAGTPKREKNIGHPNAQEDHRSTTNGGQQSYTGRGPKT